MFCRFHILAIDMRYMGSQTMSPLSQHRCCTAARSVFLRLKL